jgi:hypothetical protein
LWRGREGRQDAAALRLMFLNFSSSRMGRLPHTIIKMELYPPVDKLRAMALGSLTEIWQ